MNNQENYDEIQQILSGLNLSEKLKLIMDRMPEYVSDVSQSAYDQNIDQNKLTTLNGLIDKLSCSGIVALTKQLQDKFGVAPEAMGFGGGAAKGDEDEASKAPVKDTITIKDLTDPGKKMELIKALRELLKSGHTENPDKKTEYSLMECKALVESLPLEIKFKNVEYIAKAVADLSGCAVIQQ